MKRTLLLVITLLTLTACGSQPTTIQQILSGKEPRSWSVEANYIELAQYHELRFKPEWITPGSRLDDVVIINEEDSTATIKLGIYGGGGDWTMCLMILKGTAPNLSVISAYDGDTSERCPEFFAVLDSHPNRVQ